MAIPSNNLEVPKGPLLPLVSIVVVNYNYGRFLEKAVDSVLEQSYSEIECILIDNASTDISMSVIEKLKAKYPQINVIFRQQNGGQSAATLEGFAASTGEYVIFLDADDYLLPRCIETHIYVHLSIRFPVGFTSGDMLHAVGERVVTSTSPYFSAFIMSGQGQIPGAVRDISDMGATTWPFSGRPTGMESIHIIPPPKIDPWCWSATSANCFRRDALQFVLNNPGLKDLSYGTDGYLIRGIAALAGSALIDQPLAFYRLHGLNIFSKRPPLLHFLSFEASGRDANKQAKIQLIDHFINTAKLLIDKLESLDYYMAALEALEKVWPPLPPEQGKFQSFLAERISNNAEHLETIIGPEAFAGWLSRLDPAPTQFFSLEAESPPQAKSERKTLFYRVSRRIQSRLKPQR